MTAVRCDEPGCSDPATRYWATYARGVLVARRHTCRAHEERMSDRTIPQDHPATLSKALDTRATVEPAPRKRPRSAVGEAVALHHEAAEHCEALYLQAQGEVTDETEAAESRRDLTAREALEALARYERWLDAQEHAIAQEREALDRLQRGIAKRRTWADAQIVALAEAVAPDRSRLQAGTRTIKLQRTTAVETGEGFDPSALPPSWRRRVPEKVTPARDELDKKAAAADMLLGYREGEPPAAGWYDVEGHGRMWLSQALGDWWASRRPEDEQATALSSFGLSIEPEPGLDVLRWRPSPPGVTLVHRTHVKVD